jgi:hypothetical protein
VPPSHLSELPPYLAALLFRCGAPLAPPRFVLDAPPGARAWTDGASNPQAWALAQSCQVKRQFPSSPAARMAPGPHPAPNPMVCVRRLLCETPHPSLHIEHQQHATCGPTACRWTQHATQLKPGTSSTQRWPINSLRVRHGGRFRRRLQKPYTPLPASGLPACVRAAPGCIRIRTDRRRPRPVLRLSFACTNALGTSAWDRTEARTAR